MSHLIGKFFRHYKGNYYYVQSCSIHTETEDVLVNYHSLYSTDKHPFGQLWSRPLNMWNEHVNDMPRFIEVHKSNVPVSAYNEFLIQQAHK